MAANKYGIDLASVFRNAEAVKGARTQNRLSALQLGEAERRVAERPEKERVANERNNVLTGLRQKTVAGDENAARQYLAIGGDPSFLDAVGKMDDKQIKQSKQAIEEKGNMLASVFNAKPERQQMLYKQMLSMLPEESIANMPKEFDPNFVEMSLAKVSSMDKILENPKALKVGNQNVVYQAGREIERGTIPATEGGEGGLKAGDESLMYKQAAAYFGGIIDPVTGEMSGILQNNVPKAQAIAAEATQLFKAGGISRSQAIQQAASKYGILPTAQEGAPQPQPDPNDPLGIRI